MMDLSPFITLRPKRASLHLAHSTSGSEARAISLDVDLSPGEDVRTPDKRSLRGAEWTVRLVEAEAFNESAKAEGAIGYLSHLEERSSDDDYSPEGCHVSAALSPDTFASLLEVMQTGRLPDWLSVRVKGLSYGWEPDGSGKEWDIGQTRHAPVPEVAFRLPLAAIPKQTAEPAEAQEEQTASFPATSADLKALESSLVTAAKELHRQSLASVKLLVVLVFVLVLLVLFK